MEPTHNITTIELPQEVTTPLFKIAKDIDQYGLFMSDNQIWLETGEKKKYFKSVSNFKISIFSPLGLDLTFVFFQLAECYHYTIFQRNPE